MAPRSSRYDMMRYDAMLPSRRFPEGPSNVCARSVGLSYRGPRRRCVRDNGDKPAGLQCRQECSATTHLSECVAVPEDRIQRWGPDCRIGKFWEQELLLAPFWLVLAGRLQLQQRCGSRKQGGLQRSLPCHCALQETTEG